MARKKASVEFNDFTQGFITEASPLTFPENASLDEENVNINPDGTRQRRFGMEWTDVADTITQALELSDVSQKATSSYSWFSAGNDGNQNLGVLQHGATLYFYDLDAEDVSQNLLDTEVMGPGIHADDDIPFVYTSAYGKLIVAAGTEYVNVLSWDGVVITRQTFRLHVRDRWGVDDGLGVDSRTALLSNNHEYNLRNQGWGTDHRLANVNSDGTIIGTGLALTGDTIQHTFNVMSFYPSNSDLIWANRLTAGATALQLSNIDAYDPSQLNKQSFGTTPAPQGKAIIDVFRRSVAFNPALWRTRQLAFTTIPGPSIEDYNSGYISSVSSFAGRIWYTLKVESTVGGDDRSPNISSMVVYSQATEDVSRWGDCHARNDPTAETLNDVLASDGGFIALEEAGDIFRTVPLGESLFVFASNGVWEIFGGDTTFSATQQSVLKVIDRGVISERSIIQGENLIGYWSESGIYGVSLSENSLRGVATNITETTIQSFYDDIPTDRKKKALGSFDSIGKQVSWLYSLTDLGSDYYFNKELILDLNKTAFTKRNINSLVKTLGHGPYITATLGLKKLLTGSTQEVVTDGGVPVTDGGVEVTTTISDAEQGTKSSLMYWIADFDGTDEFFRLGGYLDFDFIDYPRIQDASLNFGSDAEAFILTGYLTGGDSSRTKWLPYITVKLKRTESDWLIDGGGVTTVIGESSCTMQAQWQWTNDPLAGFWSTPQEVYRLPRFFTLDPTHNLSFDVVSTRNKVKGSGDALSLKFSSSPLKDMVLYGWGVEIELDEKV